ncbi:unnamed protein product [Darwinula stevensoni]|uniref:Small ribosomal subunit protein bS16m n=1 Tax=Darwinula stevensoni TaxID=69355 RepID=A0A7R9ACK5_9CRUS|nr:unnamed protein product [Darwinula stevensoni]CAG0900442.1 unnamed protein product [Darwinula stevensoni]
MGRSHFVIRMVHQGCANRPFYHLVVHKSHKNQHDPPIEQVGSFDPMLNENNEKLVAVNMERLKFWLGKGAKVSTPCAEVLGIVGVLPIHPRTYMQGWRMRLKDLGLEEELKPPPERLKPYEEATKPVT